MAEETKGQAQDTQKKVHYYVELGKKVVMETKITGDVSQDNFIKGLICLMVICLLTGNGSEIFITLVSCLYPGYMSVKAVLSKDTEDDQRWLKYWVLVAALLLFQVVGDCLLCWVPGYCLAKAGLLIWCQAPREDNGSVVLFNSVVRPINEKYSADIDKMMTTAATSAEEMIKTAVVSLEEEKKQ